MIYTFMHVFLNTQVAEFRGNQTVQKSKMSQPIRCKGGHLGFPIGQKNPTNLVEDVDILLPVKFR